MVRLILSTLLVASAAAAFSQSPETTKRGPSNDPNEVVCVVERELGSRLARRRVCRTRAEWEQHHRQLRMAVEKAQYDKPTKF